MSFHSFTTKQHTMSIMAGEPRRFESDESSFSPAFLAPNSSSYPASPYERRDSLVSTQSLSSCGGSFASDFSVPVTPTCAQSPLAHNSFVDASTYDQEHSMHGLPNMMFRPKEQYVPVPELYSGMMMQIPQLPMAQDFVAYSGPGVEHGVDVSMATTAPTWAPINAWSEEQEEVMAQQNCDYTHDHDQQTQGTPYPSQYIFLQNNDQQRFQGARQGFQSPYNSGMPNSFDPSMPTEIIISADSMMDDSDNDNSDDYTMKVDNDTSPPPTSPLVKQEYDQEYQVELERLMEHHAPSRMYVKSTGGKGVIKTEYRTPPSISKKKSVKKYRNHSITQSGVKFEVPVEVHPPSAYRCHRCGKKFKRTEHRKRHLKTHEPEIAVWCDIEKCTKGFNRNDNYIAHLRTHIFFPGKKGGKNDKFPLQKVLNQIRDPKLREKIKMKYQEDAGIFPGDIKARL